MNIAMKAAVDPTQMSKKEEVAVAARATTPSSVITGTNNIPVPIPIIPADSPAENPAIFILMKCPFI